jgi:hypothetical protein
VSESGDRCDRCHVVAQGSHSQDAVLSGSLDEHGEHAVRCLDDRETASDDGEPLGDRVVRETDAQEPGGHQEREPEAEPRQRFDAECASRDAVRDRDQQRCPAKHEQRSCDATRDLHGGVIMPARAAGGYGAAPVPRVWLSSPISAATPVGAVTRGPYGR